MRMARVDSCRLLIALIICLVLFDVGLVELLFC